VKGRGAAGRPARSRNGRFPNTSPRLANYPARMSWGPSFSWKKYPRDLLSVA